MLRRVENNSLLAAPLATTRNQNNVSQDNDLIEKDQFRQLADRAARRDWKNLAIALGVLEYDIEAYVAKNSSDPRAAV